MARKRKSRAEELPKMIEVICIAPIVDENIVFTTNEFTKNYTYIAMISGKVYMMENNKDKTRRIPAEIFKQHFMEAM